jgi:hypothetical protein
MTRRLKSKAMRETTATVKAFAESDTGREIRETVRLFSDSDVCRKLRQSVAGLDLDRLRAAALAARDVAKEAEEALAGLTADDNGSDAPTIRPRRKGGRPPDHDWKGAKQHLSTWVKTNDLPPVKQRLIEVAQDWFKKIDGGAPNDRDIRRILVDPLYL